MPRKSSVVAWKYFYEDLYIFGYRIIKDIKYKKILYRVINSDKEKSFTTYLVNTYWYGITVEKLEYYNFVLANMYFNDNCENVI